MRPIDAASLSGRIALHRQPTDQKCEMDRQWAVGYNAGLDRALYSIAYAKTITPPPSDPLTLEELWEMDGSRCGSLQCAEAAVSARGCWLTQNTNFVEKHMGKWRCLRTAARPGLPTAASRRRGRHEAKRAL